MPEHWWHYVPLRFEVSLVQQLVLQNGMSPNAIDAPWKLSYALMDFGSLQVILASADASTMFRGPDWPHANLRSRGEGEN